LDQVTDAGRRRLIAVNGRILTYNKVGQRLHPLTYNKVARDGAIFASTPPCDANPPPRAT
jgi:hypothetical protein